MGHKILLADDSITIQKVIELTFSDEDFELHTVGNGQKAIDEIRSIMPDIVLCDIIMPEKNGYEVCEFIKTASDLKRIPVLLLTGAFEPFDQERAKAAGCDGFLAKPFEPQTLISKVKELLESAAQAEPAPAAAPEKPSDADETVLAPPPSLSATAPAQVAEPPAQASSAPAQQSPPEAQPSAAHGDQASFDAQDRESGGLDEAFAIEAGERELSMDPGDHTVLLGDSKRSSAAAAPKQSDASSGDDIWGDVHTDSPPAAPPAEEESATVFMSAPPTLSPEPQVTQDQDTAAFGSSDPDTTWQLPQERQDGGASASSDFGGFEDFADMTVPESSESDDATPPSTPRFEAAAPPPPPPPPPAPEPSPEPEPFEAASEAGPYPEFEPVQDFESVQEFEPIGQGDDGFDRPAPANEAAEEAGSFDTPTTPFEAEPAAASVPEPEPEAQGAPEPAPQRESEPEPEAEREPEIVADAYEPPSREDASFAEVEAEAEVEAGIASGESGTRTNGAGTLAIDEELIDRIAQRVVDKLSSKVLQEIAWEVVPDLAEGLIQKEIDALKAKIPK